MIGSIIYYIGSTIVRHSIDFVILQTAKHYLLPRNMNIKKIK